jgi:sirohydrochlorin cobaltochelatase
MKTGILFVAHGTGRQKAQQALHAFDAMAADRFPHIPIRWAFTSDYIREKLAGKGWKTDSVIKALEKMRFERYERVAVQSLHIIPGEYTDELAADIAQFRDPDTGFRDIVLGRPLLGTPEDASPVAEAVFSIIPGERRSDEAVILMSHGSDHEGDAMYSALNSILHKRDPLLFTAGMKGALTLEPVLGELKSRHVKRAWLVPLQALAGSHVLKDMCGESPTSWKSILEASGISCECLLKGTAESPAFAAVWLSHLADAVRAW